MLYDDDGLGYKPPTSQRPSCQVAGCFEPASVYVVIKETDINALNIESKDKQQVVIEREDTLAADVNAFKLILYLCARHDYDLKYLLKENELEIAKRRHLVLKETE
jgi:hypothetical protein